MRCMFKLPLQMSSCAGSLPVMKAPMEESTLSCEPTFSMGVGLFTPSLLRGATISCTGNIDPCDCISSSFLAGS